MAGDADEALAGPKQRSKQVSAGIKPFWRYYGGKFRAAPRYPRPLHSTIIEPFAGAAGYSLRYPEHRVVLYCAEHTQDADAFDEAQRRRGGMEAWWKSSMLDPIGGSHGNG